MVFDEHQLYQRGRFQEFAVIVDTSVGYTPVNHSLSKKVYILAEVFNYGTFISIQTFFHTKN